jgi:hypothetical protein
MTDALRLKISLDALRHLGMNLYDSLPPVLSELVANAYDARARKVSIDLSDDQVVITDDGVGMTRDEVQDQYLLVGRDRRADTRASPNVERLCDWPERPKPMGRKGIGKLAMFSIASEVEIHTVQLGEKTAFRMHRDRIAECARSHRDYSPEAIDCVAGLDNGTRVVLKGLERKRAISPSRVRAAIARRFSVIDVDTETAEYQFVVEVDGTVIGPNDWDIFGRLQYIWVFGGEVSEKYRKRCGGNCKSLDRADVVRLPDGAEKPLVGWIGTVHRPRQLRSTTDGVTFNDNRIVVDCRGKVAVANFLHQFGEAGVYASYLAGYLRADFLDEGEDIATSDRERVREDDPRVQSLAVTVKEVIKAIEAQWSELRRLDEGGKLEQHPAVSKWIASLNADERDDARHLLGRIGASRFASEADRVQVLKFGILAFERLRVRHRLSLIRATSIGQLELVATMFSLESDLENALYAEIASQRLEVIRELEKIVDANEKEKIVQKHIYDNLWLLEPSWTKADQVNRRLEQSVAKEFREVQLTEEERSARLDIRYRKSGGVHIIVELKRPGVRTPVYRLLEQVHKYKAALRKSLEQVEGERQPRIQCVCLVGAMPELDGEQEGALLSANTKVLTYDQVIRDSQERFADFLSAEGRLNTVQSVLRELDAAVGDGAEQD